MKIADPIIYLFTTIIAISGCTNEIKEKPAETDAKNDTAGNVAVTARETDTLQKSPKSKSISFDVRTSGETTSRQLLVETHGLEHDQVFKLKMEGKLTDTLVTDLNADGFPELLVVTQSEGSGSYGSVIAYSVNNGKSVSQVSFQPDRENPELNKGYMGHDRFYIKDFKLFREFPIYKQGDPNANPTGGLRRIKYKLVDGEASRMLVADKIMDLPLEK